MNSDNVRDVAIKALSRGALKARKYAPEILTGVGIIGGITAAVWAAKSSVVLKDETAEVKQLIKDRKELRKDMNEEEYPTKKYQRDITVAYYLYGKQLAKLYGPAVGIGAASIVCILAAHGVLQKRNASLVAAYNAVEVAYKAYRKRVQEEFGEEKELSIFRGLKEVTTEEVGEDGKKHKKKDLVQEENAGSPYRVCFDEFNPEWSRDPDHNLTYLQCQQRYANDMLRAHGHIFLNDVLSLLHMPDTSAGAVVGWLYEGDGDNYVDFGIYDMNDTSKKDFIFGSEKSIWLDFNVDGLIWDKI